MFRILIVLALACFSTSIIAAGTHEAQGTIKSVKSDVKKVTISHGPVKTMGMGAMTMDFGFNDPAMFAEMKAGKNIKFKFEDKPGGFVITEFDLQ